jgi:hypothetical protein
MARRSSSWERARALRPQQGQPPGEPEDLKIEGMEAEGEGPPALPREAHLTPVEPAAPPKPEEPHVLFGTKHDQKTIAIAAGIGFAFIGIIYGAMAYNDPKLSKGLSPYLTCFFAALHGGMAFGLITQLALVYRDRVVVLCTILGILLGEFGFLWGSGQMENFVLDRLTFGMIVAVFFWSGFVGFWVGFIFYAKRLQRLQRFQSRYRGRSEEI